VNVSDYQEIGFIEFQRRFQTDEQCLEFLKAVRWPNGFVCPRCGHTEAYWIDTRKQFQCKGCRHQTSLTANTIFHRSHLPLWKWFWAIYLVGADRRGVSGKYLERFLEIPYSTAWLLLQKIRNAMQDRDTRYILEHVVEMDESFFGGSAAGKRGRGAENKAQVIVAVENRGKSAGYAKMTVVEALDGATVETTAKKTVKEGATVRTDGYSSYRVLAKRYTHDGKKVEAKDASKMLPWVHTLIGNTKTFLRGTYHGVSQKHLQRYLDEFCYRHNRRFKGTEIFQRMLTAAIAAPVITYAGLTR
jgi:transposase-like protein